MIHQLGKYIFFAGIILIIAGLILIAGGEKLRWLGHLPGDIRIEKDNFRFYFPLATMVLISIIITLLINIIKKLL